MSSIIQIKRSGTQLEPTSLQIGELAYSYADSSRRLFIGVGSTDSFGNAERAAVIGGEYFIDFLDADSPGIAKANKFLILGDSLDVDYLKIYSLDVDSAFIEYANIDSADIQFLRVEDLRVNYLQADSADVTVLRAEEGIVKQLTSDSAYIQYANIDSADIDLLYAKDATIDSAYIQYAYIDSSDIFTTRIENADIDSSYTRYAKINYADIDSTDIDYANILKADIDSSYTRRADIDYAKINYANIDSADISKVRINYAEIDSAYISQLFVDSAYINRLDVDSGYIGQFEADSAKIEILYTGFITGPSTIIIDPAGLGDNTGKLLVLGDLQVEGETTTVNSTTVTINDKNIILADSAPDSAFADGAGITIAKVDASLTYRYSDDRFISSKDFGAPRLYSDSAEITNLIATNITNTNITSDSGRIVNISGVDLNYQTGYFDELTAKDLSLTSITPYKVIISDSQGNLAGDEDLIFDLEKFAISTDRFVVNRNTGRTEIFSDLLVESDVTASTLTLKKSAVNSVLFIGEGNIVEDDPNIIFGVPTTEFGTFNGLNIGLERLFDSGYYRFSVNQQTGDVAAQGMKVGKYTTRPVGQFSPTYPVTGPYDFYGLEVSNTKLLSTVQLNEFRSDISQDSALQLEDSFSEEANIIQVKSVLDSTLFEVKKDGSINFFGALLKEGIPFEGGGVFSKGDYQDAYYIGKPVSPSFPDNPFGAGRRVGIGTTSPKHKLEISNGELFISGSLDASGSTYPELINVGYNYNTPSSKFLFFPQKAATRGGYWDTTAFTGFNFGNYSTAFGRNVNAVGISSIALGDSSSAVDDYTVAIGKNNNTGTNNDRTVAIGMDNTVSANSGNYIIVLGSGNTNGGDETHIIGRNNTVSALGDRSYIFGRENTLNNIQSTIIGASNIIEGANARIFGRDNLVTSFGAGSTIIGNDNTAAGQQAIVIGSNSKANGQNSIAIGPDISVNGNFSVGVSITGAQQKQTIDSDNVFAILGGSVLINPTADSYQVGSNALVVVGDILYTGQFRQAVEGGGTVSGNIFVDDGTDVTYTEGKNLGIHVETPYHRVQTAGSFSIRDENPGTIFIPTDPDADLILDSTANEHRQFIFHPASGVLRAGEIQYQPNDSIGILSFGFGYLPKAGNYSFAAGYNVIANGEYSVGIGKDIQNFGNRSYIIGDNIVNNGNQSVVLGRDNTVFGNGAYVIGHTNTDVETGQNNFVVGHDNIFDGEDLYILGKNNNLAGTNNVSVGSNIINGNNSVALGNGHSIATDDAYALGQNVTITSGAADVVVINPEGTGYTVDSVSNQVIIPGTNTDVAIGKTAANYKLDVAGDINLDGRLYIQDQPAGIFEYDSNISSYIVPAGLSIGGNVVVDVDSLDGLINFTIDSAGVTIYDSLGVLGNASIAGDLTVGGNQSLGGSLTLDSDQNITLKKGDITVSDGSVTVFGNLTVDSSTYVRDLFIKGISFDSYLIAALTGRLDDLLGPESAVGSIDTITSASPIVVTTFGPHGLGDNWTIEFDSVQGMTTLNTGTYYVDIINTQSFELWNDTDGNAARLPIDGTLLGTHVQGTGTYIGIPYVGGETTTAPTSLLDGLLDLIDTDYVQARVSLDNFWAYTPSVGPPLSFNFDPTPNARVPVGIHTRSPGINYSLDVNGNVNVGGDLYIGDQIFTDWFADNGGGAVSQIVDGAYINALVEIDESTIANYIDSSYIMNIIDSAYILERSKDSSYWQRTEDTLFFGTYPNVYNVRVGIGTDQPVSKFQVAGKGTFDSGIDVGGNLYVKDFKITTDSSYEYTFDVDNLNVTRSAVYDEADIEQAYFAQVVDSTDTTFLLNLGFDAPYVKYLNVYTIDKLGDSIDLTLAESAGVLGVSGDFIITGPTDNFIQVSTDAVDSDNLSLHFIERRLPSNQLVLADSDNFDAILDYNPEYVQIIVKTSLGATKSVLTSTDYTLVDNNTIVINDSDYLDLGDKIVINDRSPKVVGENQLWGKLDQYGNVIIHDGSLTVDNDLVTLGTLSVFESASFSSIIEAPEVEISTKLTNNGTTYFNGDVYYDSTAIFYYGPSVVTNESDGLGNRIIRRLSFDSNIERIVDSNYIGDRLLDIWSFRNDEFGNQQIYYDGGGAVIIGRPEDILPGDSDTKFLSIRGNAIFAHDSTDNDPLNITDEVVPNYGPGTRMMWIPQRGAFRAGTVTDLGDGSTVWDDDRVGMQSIGIGFDAEAGNYSVAMGYGVSAGTRKNTEEAISVSYGINIINQGTSSIAIGRAIDHTLAENTISIGREITNLDDNNLAIGDNITVSRDNAQNVGIGKNVTVSGSSNGVAIGRDVTSSNGGISIGDTNTASNSGVAIGRDNTANYGVSVGINATTSRSNSVSIGVNSIAGGTGSSTAIGRDAVASTSGTAIGRSARSGDGGAVAIGSNSRSGRAAVAVGVSSTANAQNSVSLGRSNEGVGRNGVSLGSSNKASTGGTAIGISNNASISGVAIGRSNYALRSVVFGSNNSVSNGNAIAIGYDNTGSNGIISVGKNNKNNNYGSAFGVSNSSNFRASIYGQTNNSNTRTLVYGDLNNSNVDAFVYGSRNTGSSRGALVYGSNNTSINQSHVYGRYNTSQYRVNVYGNYNTGATGAVSDYGYIFGNASKITNYGFAYGSRNSITDGGFAFGAQSVISVGGYSYGEANDIAFGGFAFGKDNVLDGTEGTPYAFGLGNIVSDNAIAFGKNNTVSGSSVALGTSNEATGLNSLALGSNILVSGNNSVGIGLSSVDLGDSVATNNTLAILGGQVAIGLNDPYPLYQLEVEGSYNVRSGDIYRRGKRLYNYIQDDVANRAWIRFNADSNYIYTAVNLEYLRETQIPQFFFHNDLSNLYYTGGGNVGIKTSNPQYDLHVNGDINFDGKLYVSGIEVVPSVDSINDVAVSVNYYQSYYYIDSATTVTSFIDSAYVQQRQAYFDYETIIDEDYVNSRVDFSFLPDSAYIEEQIDLFAQEVVFKKDFLGHTKYKNTGPVAPFQGTRVGIGYDSNEFLTKGAGLDVKDGGVFIENGNLEITNGSIYIDGELFEPVSPFIDDGTFVTYKPLDGPTLNVGIGKFTPRFALDVAGDINIDDGFNFKINDQNLLHEILDSAYVISKLDFDLFLDSAEARAMFDSAYILSIADSDYVKTVIDSSYILGVADSAYVQSIIDSNYILNIADSAYILSIADSGHILGIADSAYVQSIIDSDYIKGIVDSAYVLSIADSDYIRSAADSDYIRSAVDSDYIRSAADSDYIKTAADSDWIKFVANELYVKSIANIPYVQSIANEEYIKGFIDSDHINGITGIGTRDIDFGNHKILFSNDFANVSAMPNAGIYEGMFAYNKNTKQPVVADNGAWVPLARENENVIFNRVETTDGLVVGGDLQVNGTTSTVNSVTLEVTDNMIYMNAAESEGSPTQFVDVGFAANYNDIGSYAHTGFFRDATDGIWKIFEGYTPEPDASPQINTEDPSFSLATLQVGSIIVDNISRVSPVEPGIYGSASLIPVITLDSSGFIDSIGEVTVAGVTGVSFDSGVGTFTINTADGNSFSALITLDPYTTNDLAEGDSNLFYTPARVQSNILEFVDSAYVQARQLTYDFLDSAEVIQLIDSAYVQSRVVPQGVDSAAVTALIDSAYVNARVSTIDSAQVLAIVDSAYILGVVGDVGIDSATVFNLIDSAYINERIGITAEVSLLANQLRYETYYFTATAGQTIFEDSDANGNVLSYSVGTAQVFVNGINLLNGVDYTATNGNQIILSSPAAGGEDVFVSTLKITGEVGFGFREFIFTADSDQTEFFGADDNGNQLQYTVGNLIIHLNGIKLASGLDYTATDGNKIVLSEGALLDDELSITTAYVENSQLDSGAGSEYGDISVTSLTNTTGTYTNLVNGIEADSAGIVVVDTVEHNSSFTSIEYLVHMEDSINNHSQISKMLVTYNKTNVFSTEYGVVNSYTNDSDMGTLSADVNGTVIRLKFEKATGTGNVTVKPVKTIIQ